MSEQEFIVAIVAILAVFGPAFYLIYLIGKLIRYRIDKKYKAESSVPSAELKKFMENTEHRLRAIEEIVADDEYEQMMRRKSAKRTIKPEKQAESDFSDEDSEDLWSGEKNKLKNQLKS